MSRYWLVLSLVTLSTLLLVCGCTTFSPTTVQTTHVEPVDVDIRSTPLGAEIYFDGEYRGTTPSILRGVSEGTHDIELRLRNYVTVSKRIEVTSGSNIYLDVVMEKSLSGSPTTSSVTPSQTSRPTTVKTTVPTTVPTTVKTTVPTTVKTTVPTTLPTTVATTVPTVYQGVSDPTYPMSSCSLEVIGPVYGLAGGDGGQSIEKIQCSVGLSYGSGPVDMTKTLITFSTAERHVVLQKSNEAASNAWRIANKLNTVTDDDMLESGESFELELTLSPGIQPNEQFNLEIQPQYGATYPIARTAPPEISSGGMYPLF